MNRLYATIAAGLVLSRMTAYSEPGSVHAEPGRIRVARGSGPSQLELAIRSGDTCRIAAVHYELNDIPKTEIVKMFQQLADSGDARSRLWLARLHFKGRCGLPLDEVAGQKLAKEEFPKVLKLANNGDREAQFLVASAYYEGLGIDQDLKKAAEWYSPAAAAGQITALNNYGLMLIHGEGCSPDVAKARSLFAQSVLSECFSREQILMQISDDHRDDTARLKALLKSPLVQALGKSREEGLALLVRNKVITDPKAYVETQDEDSRKHIHFKADGVYLIANIAGRIVEVEGHAEGAHGSSQCKCDPPLGLSWDDTAQTARPKLGEPDDSGNVSADRAMGMAYRTENVGFSVMFSYEGNRRLKIWRVNETWAVDYSRLTSESQ